MLKKKMEEQDKVIGELQKVLKEEQEQKVKGQKQITHKFQELEGMLQELRAKSDQNEAKYIDLTRVTIADRHEEYMDPAMYTHTCGYKFYAGYKGVGNYLFGGAEATPPK